MQIRRAPLIPATAPPPSFTPFIATATPRTQKEAPRCLLRPNSFQVHQGANRNKLVPVEVMNYLFLHFPFCLLFPKAKHLDQVGVRGKMPSPQPNQTCFSIVSIRTVQVFPLTLGRSHRSSFSGQPTGVGTGTPIPLLPGKQSSAHPTKRCHRSWERSASFIP